MFSRADLKSNAKQQLKDKWGLAIITCVVYTLIIQGTVILSGNSTVSETGMLYLILDLVGWVLYGPISVGICIFTLNLARNKESAKFTDLFAGIKITLKALVVSILVTIVIVIGTILFIIPGVIASLMFSQVYFILAENPELSPIQCLSKSATIMKGHKMELFILGLSFIGWIIACTLTLGIGYLWYTPYYKMTLANFYLKLSSK